MFGKQGKRSGLSNIWRNSDSEMLAVPLQLRLGIGLLQISQSALKRRANAGASGLSTSPSYFSPLQFRPSLTEIPTHLCPPPVGIFPSQHILPRQSRAVSPCIGSSPDDSLSQRTQLINALSQIPLQYGTDQLPTSGTFAAIWEWQRVGNLLAVLAAHLHRNLAALTLHRTATRRRRDGSTRSEIP